MDEAKTLINHIQSYLDSGMWQYETCYLGKSDLMIIIEALKQYISMNDAAKEV